MFQGSVPAPLRGVIHEAVKGWGSSSVYVGCSGNFTIERTLWDIGVRCHGNDVSLYSCSLGALFSREETTIRVKSEFEVDWDWLDPYLAVGQRERCAVLMLATTMLAGLGRADRPQGGSQDAGLWRSERQCALAGAGVLGGRLS
jgi:hypothetical protein